MPVLSPAINPQSVLPKRPTTVQSAQNFISGGTALGSSVVSSAANKIIGFQRAAVKPVTPDINSIVSTISSNILNQVDNSIKNATNIINKTTDLKIQKSENQIMNVVDSITPQQNNQVTQLQTVVENIQNQTTNIVEKISEDYKKRVGQIDSARPNNLLTNFIQLYKTAIDFIKFFGDRRNINTLRDNLVALRESFTESFEVAKLIRNTIVKIVGQLSSLPSATPGSSSGINLDVNVPGGGLKKTLPPGAKPSRMRGGKLGMLGLGLGGAALGGAAVNALAGSRDQVEPVPTDQSIPGQILDTFSSIISRFANAVDEMIKGGEKSKSGSQGSATSSGKKGSKPSTSPGGPGGPSTMPTVSGEGTPEQQAMLKSLRFAEGTSKSYGTIFGGNVVKELEEGKLTVQEVINMADTGKLPQRLGGGTVPGYGKGSKATGAYQFMPGTLEGLINSGALKKDELFTPQVQDRAALSLAQEKGVTADLLKKEGFSANVSNKLAPVWASVPTLSGRSYHGQPVKSLSSLQDIYNQSLKTSVDPKKGMGGPDLPDFVLSPEKREELKLTAQTVSQPPPTQTETPTITTLPLDLSGGGGGGQQEASGPIPAPIRNGAAGPSVPFLTSSDPENFLVLYSKMVYNIVGA